MKQPTWERKSIARRAVAPGAAETSFLARTQRGLPLSTRADLFKHLSFPRKRESRSFPMKQPAVYILAGRRNGTLYTGVTTDLVRRIWEHRNDLVEGFTKRYGVHSLVYVELTWGHKPGHPTGEAAHEMEPGWEDRSNRRS